MYYVIMYLFRANVTRVGTQATTRQIVQVQSNVSRSSTRTRTSTRPVCWTVKCWPPNGVNINMLWWKRFVTFSFSFLFKFKKNPEIWLIVVSAWSTTWSAHTASTRHRTRASIMVAVSIHQRILRQFGQCNWRQIQTGASWVAQPGMLQVGVIYSLIGCDWILWCDNNEQVTGYNHAVHQKGQCARAGCDGWMGEATDLRGCGWVVLDWRFQANAQPDEENPWKSCVAQNVGQLCICQSIWHLPWLLDCIKQHLHC